MWMPRRVGRVSEHIRQGFLLQTPHITLSDFILLSLYFLVETGRGKSGGSCLSSQNWGGGGKLDGCKFEASLCCTEVSRPATGMVSRQTKQKKQRKEKKEGRKEREGATERRETGTEKRGAETDNLTDNPGALVGYWGYRS